jgi:hypothetical protein
MKSFRERAAAALDLLPEEMREPAVAYLLEQGEKYRVLKELVADGLRDVDQGRVVEWNFEDFLREACLATQCHPDRDGRDKPGHDHG